MHTYGSRSITYTTFRNTFLPLPQRLVFKGYLSRWGLTNNLYVHYFLGGEKYTWNYNAICTYIAYYVSLYSYIHHKISSMTNTYVLSMAGAMASLKSPVFTLRLTGLVGHLMPMLHRQNLWHHIASGGINFLSFCQ